MKEQIELPNEVKATTTRDSLTLSGPKGENKKAFNPNHVKITVEANHVSIESPHEGKKGKRMVNTYVSHVENMVRGVTKGFEYQLVVLYSHFPMTITKKGDAIEVVNYLGSKHPKKANIVGQTKAEIKGKDITLSGPNLEDVGQTAANLERIADTAGKDRRIFQDGIYITNKADN